MMSVARGAAAWVAAAILLAGCATAPVPRAATLDSGFEFNGRFAVHYGDEAASGRLQWRHTPAEDDLTISSPLGQGLVSLVRRDSIFTLKTSDNRTLTARQAEDLTEETLGWRLPVSGLPSWLRGRPSAGSVARYERGANGRLLALMQDGWRIEYLDYFDGDELPSRLRLHGEGIDIRLVIDEWRATK